MNTNQLKRFAKEARIKLIDQISRKMDFVLSQDAAILRGKEKEIQQLKNKIQQLGKTQVVENVAYTWFNRLMALRFMDANGYNMPKIVTPLQGMSNPEILQNALAGTIDEALSIDSQRLNELLDGKTLAADAQTEAYKMLLVAACNLNHKAMPFMFERISDYTELLLPDDLLSEFSIVADVRNGMSDDDCQQEEVIGWLYQFYIADKKDDVFNGLKNNVKITAANIPAATQLFTPRWIVRYMVENTLGKLWLSVRPLSKLRDFMPYFIEPPLPPEGGSSPMPEGINGVEDITFLDPCQGSGHVLVYAFDLFTKIYEEEGYNAHEIPALILKNNLFGIDIDPRAAQLAAFALTMKARNYYSRFLRKAVLPNVLALENISIETLEESITLPLKINGKTIAKYEDLSLFQLTQADNFGSLIQIEKQEINAISIQIGSFWQEKQEILRGYAEVLSRQFHCVVTNPPYMGNGGMNDRLASLAKEKYPNSKSDLFSMFIERSIFFTSEKGYLGMVTMQSWMFLGSFEDMRKNILSNYDISTLIQIGYNSFPELNSKIVQACAFAISKFSGSEAGVYVNLNDAPQAANKEDVFLHKTENNIVFKINQNHFKKISGSPLGYWLKEKTLDQLSNSKILLSFGQATKGLDTCDNDRFVRFWYEIDKKKYSLKESNSHKWFTYHKGGDFQKWFGNDDKVVNWENDGDEIRNFRNLDGSIKSRPQNMVRYFQTGITWSSVGSSTTSYRLMSDGIFGGGGNGFFPNVDYKEHFLGFLNSKVSKYFKDLFNPTLNNLSGDLHKLPIGDFIESEDILNYVSECISLTKKYLSAKECNYSFNSLLILNNNKSSLIEELFEQKSLAWKNDFMKIHNNEVSINEKLIEIYGLQDELDPSVQLSDITILQEEAKIVDNQLVIEPTPVLLQLISYAVGCMFGRYSLDKGGLILANQGETLADYFPPQPPKGEMHPLSPPSGSGGFMPDDDNILPVLDGEWFADDIVGRFKTFLRAAFGDAEFEQNLRYIEETLGKDIRKYLTKDFYNDHVKRYKKRPIYWLFSSPKGHFKALIYLHRYQDDTCSKLLNDYLQAFITKLEASRQTQTMLTLRADITAREKVLAEKEIEKFDIMLKDCKAYEKTLFIVATQKISMDLDDGVKVNYQKFKEVLVPIKGLEKEE